MTDPAAGVLLEIQGESPEAIHDRSTDSFDVAAACVCDPTKEESEDAALVVDLADRGLVVCAIDGMGGMQFGRESARVAVEAFADRIRAVGADDNVRAAVVEAFTRAHEEVCGRCPGGGATVACAIVTEDRVQTLHAGDAEVLVIGRGGEVRHRTVAHSPVGYALDAGLLDEEQALVHAERHLVSNGLGVEGMAIHVGPRLPLAPDDTVVVATDGLTDNARGLEIAEALRCGDLHRGTGEVVGLARERMMHVLTELPDVPTIGKPDDLTVVAVRRKGT